MKKPDRPDSLQEFLEQREIATEARIHIFRITIHAISTFIAVLARLVMGTELDLMFYGVMISLPVMIIMDAAVLRANSAKTYRSWVKYIVSLTDILFLSMMLILIRIMIPREFYPLAVHVPAFTASFFIIALSGFRFDRNLTFFNGLTVFLLTIAVMIWDILTVNPFIPLWIFSYFTVLSIVLASVFLTSFISNYARSIIEENYKRLEEKLYVTGVFGRYVSAEVAEKALSGELELGGEEKIISVLFCDIRNFTSFSEKTSPAEIVALLNRFFSLMTPAVFEQEGIVDKMIGDCLMALFGAPIHMEDFRLRAVRAAMKIRERLVRLNAELTASGKPEISIGIGISTGPAIVGNIGSSERMEFTAIGDTVNTASRIEGLCKHFGRALLVDEQTRKGIGEEYSLVPMDPVEVKGKKDKIQVYAVEEKI
jgi:class 3 adenylate cyclase